MSPPLLSVEEGGGQVTVSFHPAPMDQAGHNATDLKERNYLGLTDCSSLDGSGQSRVLVGNKSNLNLRATELRLGLPGLQSPEREQDYCLNSGNLDGKQLFPSLPLKDGTYSSPHKKIFSGSKRGFSDVVEGNWMFPVIGSKSEILPSVATKHATKSTINDTIPPKNSQPAATREVAPKEKTADVNGILANQLAASNKDRDSSPPATKALVVGWPPIRSFRKNSLATTSKNNDEVDGKPGPGALFVKVSMDGAPYLRKVDLRNYSSYQELSSALEKMFSCFTLGQYGCQGGLEKGSLSESKLKDLLHGSEYVLTYEDKDSDWMLVGDVPWEMFIETCRKLKIMKSSDAIGLASPRAMDKSKNIN